MFTLLPYIYKSPNTIFEECVKVKSRNSVNFQIIISNSEIKQILCVHKTMYVIISKYRNIYFM